MDCRERDLGRTAVTQFSVTLEGQLTMFDRKALDIEYCQFCKNMLIDTTEK